LGQAQSPARLSADTTDRRRSPRYLGDEEQFFGETRSVIERAKPGDLLYLQMYEFENELTHGNTHNATGAPGYADQQAILPGLVEAAKRGVNVQLVLDESSSMSGQVPNKAIVKYLRKNAPENLTIDFYPKKEVNIDHAKELVHLSPKDDGSYEVQEAITGGSNYGNHTAANNDGGAAFYGGDALGAAVVFQRDQAYCRRLAYETPALPEGPVQWLETSKESDAVREQMLELLRQCDTAWIQQFVLTHGDVMDGLKEKGTKAHVVLDSGWSTYDKEAEADMLAAGVNVVWSNPTGGAKMHRKEGIYLDAQGDFLAGQIGSANATAKGLNKSTSHRRANHEIVAFVRPYESAHYSTKPLLQGMLEKAQENLANGVATPTPVPIDTEEFLGDG
jgi:hypothetical protein